MIVRELVYLTRFLIFTVLVGIWMYASYTIAVWADLRGLSNTVFAAANVLLFHFVTTKTALKRLIEFD